MRVPLPTDFAARLSSASKDARMINGLSEEKSSGLVVLNRPGLVDTGYDYSQGQGLLGLNGLLYLVYGDKFELSAYTGTPLPGGILIGDLVDGYYAMVDDPPTPPGPGDYYWSASPAGTKRYQVYSAYGLILRSYNSPDYWAYRGDVTFGSATLDIEPTLALAASREAAILQAIASLPTSCPGLNLSTRLDFSGYISYSKFVQYYPNVYQIDASYVDVNSVVMYSTGDTVNTGFHYDGYPDITCGYARLTPKDKGVSAIDTPPADPSCVAATNAYSPDLFLVRVV